MESDSLNILLKVLNEHKEKKSEFYEGMISNLRHGGWSGLIGSLCRSANFGTTFPSLLFLNSSLSYSFTFNANVNWDYECVSLVLPIPYTLSFSLEFPGNVPSEIVCGIALSPTSAVALGNSFDAVRVINWPGASYVGACLVHTAGYCANYDNTLNSASIIPVSPYLISSSSQVLTFQELTKGVVKYSSSSNLSSDLISASLPLFTAINVRYLIIACRSPAPLACPCNLVMKQSPV